MDGEVQPPATGSVRIGRQPPQRGWSDSAEDDPQDPVWQAHSAGPIPRPGFGQVMEQGRRDQVMLGVAIGQQARRDADGMSLVVG